MIDNYLKQLQEATAVGRTMIKFAGKLNFEKRKCQKMKNPQDKKECWRVYRLKYANIRVANVHKMIAKCKDDVCRKKQAKNLQAAQAALAKAKGAQ